MNLGIGDWGLGIGRKIKLILCNLYNINIIIFEKISEIILNILKKRRE